MGEVPLADSILCDGLTDAFHNYHMGITGKADVAANTSFKKLTRTWNSGSDCIGSGSAGHLATIVFHICFGQKAEAYSSTQRVLGCVWYRMLHVASLNDLSPFDLMQKACGIVSLIRIGLW